MSWLATVRLNVRELVDVAWLGVATVSIRGTPSLSSVLSAQWTQLAPQSLLFATAKYLKLSRFVLPAPLTSVHEAAEGVLWM